MDIHNTNWIYEKDIHENILFFVSSETHLAVGVGCKEVVGGVEKRGEKTDWEEETIFAINCRVEGRKKKNRKLKIEEVYDILEGIYTRNMHII